MNKTLDQKLKSAQKEIQRLHKEVNRREYLNKVLTREKNTLMKENEYKDKNIVFATKLMTYIIKQTGKDEIYIEPETLQGLKEEIMIKVDNEKIICKVGEKNK